MFLLVYAKMRRTGTKKKKSLVQTERKIYYGLVACFIHVVIKRKR